MYKKKISYCLDHKHLDNKILINKKNYSWKMCKLCGLIYSDVKNKKNKYYLNKLSIFNSFEKGNSYEFTDILKKVSNFFVLKKGARWLDFGCGAGGELEIIKKRKLNSIGFEPNYVLYKKCKSRKLNVFNKINNIRGKFDYIFTRNTFKYINNFPKNISMLSNLLKKKGILIWRDKYFDFKDLSYSIQNEKETMVSGSFLTKKVIKNYLVVNNLRIIFEKFYFDESFLIIAVKEKVKNETKEFEYKYNHSEYYSTNSKKIQFYLRKLFQKIYITIRILKSKIA